MTKALEELLLDFEIPAQVETITQVRIYEQGTKSLVGFAEFGASESIGIYLKEEYQKRIGNGSSEDLEKKLNGRTYRLELCPF